MKNSSRSNLKKKCPYCGKVVNTRGLNVHVMNSSNEEHGPFRETPDGFDPNDVEAFVEDAKNDGSKENVTTPRRETMENRIFLCNYCNELCEGLNGLEVHLRDSQGDVLHPEDASVEDNEFTIIPADDNYNPIMDLDDVYRIQKHRRQRGNIFSETKPERFVDGENIVQDIATVIEQKPELEDQPERVMALFDATETQFKQGVTVAKNRR